MSASLGNGSVELKLSNPTLAALAAKVDGTVSTGSEPIAILAGFLGALLGEHQRAASSSDAEGVADITSLIGDVSTNLSQRSYTQEGVTITGRRKCHRKL